MATFKFKVPYSQRQIIIADGVIDCEIEADSKEQALQIFRENSYCDNCLVDGRRIVASEDELEVVQADDKVFDEKEITWE
jgi:hypothetical protein